LRPDGSRRELAKNVPAGFKLALGAAALAPDGSAYFAGPDHRQVYRAASGELKVVAGRLDGSVPPPEDTEIWVPMSASILPDGSAYVADQARRQIMKVTPDGQSSVFAGSGEYGDQPGTTKTARFYRPYVVRHDSKGNVYLLQDYGGAQTPDGIRHDVQLMVVTPDGQVKSLSKPAGVGLFGTFDVASDGTILMSSANKLFLVDPTSGVATAVPGMQSGRDARGVRAHPAGGFFFFGRDSAGGGHVSRWTKEKGIEHVFSGEGHALESFKSVAIDSKGRYYVLDTDASCNVQLISRYDPADKSYKAFAGRGTGLLAGKTADDALLFPVEIDIDEKDNLYVLDAGVRQVKRVPADKL
jgi:hypothetical protein